MMCRVRVLLNGEKKYLNEETLELLDTEYNSTLFFSRNEAIKFIRKYTLIANDYNNKINSITNQESKQIVSNFINAETKNNLLYALMHNAEIQYICA